MAAEQDLHVDNTAHRLYFRGKAFPCDRDIEVALPWREYALTLSSDTDCLSLWDTDGLVRLIRVGVYPQDMALQQDTAYVCGGADGKLHLLNLPSLEELAEYSLPGMPERLCIAGDTVFVLTLLTEPEVHTGLLQLPQRSGRWVLLRRLRGIPEAISEDRSGLWITVSEGCTHLCWDDIGT